MCTLFNSSLEPIGHILCSSRDDAQDLQMRSASLMALGCYTYVEPGLIGYLLSFAKGSTSPLLRGAAIRALVRPFSSYELMGQHLDALDRLFDCSLTLGGVDPALVDIYLAHMDREDIQMSATQLLFSDDGSTLLEGLRSMFAKYSGQLHTSAAIGILRKVGDLLDDGEFNAAMLFVSRVEVNAKLLSELLTLASNVYVAAGSEARLRTVRLALSLATSDAAMCGRLQGFLNSLPADRLSGDFDHQCLMDLPYLLRFPLYCLLFAGATAETWQQVVYPLIVDPRVREAIYKLLSKGGLSPETRARVLRAMVPPSGVALFSGSIDSPQLLRYICDSCVSSSSMELSKLAVRASRAFKGGETIIQKASSICGNSTVANWL